MDPGQGLRHLVPAGPVDFIFDIPTIIEHLSETITLLPGDVILTGTPAGVGRIVAGDRVDIAIDGLGVLSNPVMDA